MADRIYNVHMDILRYGPAQPDAYSVVLFGYRDGAAPQIFEITWNVFRDRLESTLAWHQKVLDAYEQQLKDAGRLTNIPLNATLQQLHLLGFQGL